jgi:hypothetical protein
MGDSFLISRKFSKLFKEVTGIDLNKKVFAFRQGSFCATGRIAFVLPWEGKESKITLSNFQIFASNEVRTQVTLNCTCLFDYCIDVMKQSGR